MTTSRLISSVLNLFARAFNVLAKPTRRIARRKGQGCDKQAEDGEELFGFNVHRWMSSVRAGALALPSADTFPPSCTRPRYSRCQALKAGLSWTCSLPRRPAAMLHSARAKYGERLREGASRVVVELSRYFCARRSTQGQARPPFLRCMSMPHSRALTLSSRALCACGASLAEP